MSHSPSLPCFAARHILQGRPATLHPCSRPTPRACTPPSTPPHRCALRGCTCCHCSARARCRRIRASGSPVIGVRGHKFFSFAGRGTQVVAVIIACLLLFVRADERLHRCPMRWHKIRENCLSPRTDVEDAPVSVKLAAWRLGGWMCRRTAYKQDGVISPPWS